MRNRLSKLRKFTLINENNIEASDKTIELELRVLKITDTIKICTDEKSFVSKSRKFSLIK